MKTDKSNFIFFNQKRNQNGVTDCFIYLNFLLLGAKAEKLRRKWISIEIIENYVIGSAFR